MSSAANAPPAYEDAAPQQGTSSGERMFGDDLPDDFKYSVDVASCELPLRQLFIRKVYSLLSVQLAVTVIVGFIINSNKGIQTWCLNNIWLYYLLIVGTFGFLIATWFKSRSYPTNLILLGGFTLCESYSVGLCTVLFDTNIVIQAVLLTFVIFIGLTLFAFQTKYDFISWEGGLSMALWMLICFGFVAMFLPGNTSTVELIYAGVSAVIFTIYIVIDTQKIMKTAHLDDEVIATISLYLDIINLFLAILRILNNQNRD
ncbi:uncharacterized protein KQ657_004027 [Scheffersomyces spartinae]|uniref:Uncharacterized protein n=1 Tax=Scheffersomyces spartinae TaxID=45513 RepID=A0A9P7VCR0_9ASCO|nr:uncharacterized protein KQ657_004027 [Scheffersomyces spartinae]KAG7194919.1 hypothetical protein KQ657_004027 [Scheffersomyces spartinae]